MWFSMNRPRCRTYGTRSMPLVCLLVALPACVDSTSSPGVVRQMHTSISPEETRLDATDTWSVVPRAAVIVTTSEESTIHALFIAEAVGKVGTQIGNIPSFNPEIGEWELDTVLELLGTPIDVRLRVDDEVMVPSSTQFVGHGTALASYSFLAIHDDVGPGTHSVIVEWRSKNEGAFMRNRTLTVWETGRGPLASGAAPASNGTAEAVGSS